MNGGPAHDVTSLGGLFGNYKREHPTLMPPEILWLSAGEREDNRLILEDDARDSPRPREVFQSLQARIRREPVGPQSDRVPGDTQFQGDRAARPATEHDHEHDPGPHHEAGGRLPATCQ